MMTISKACVSALVLALGVSGAHIVEAQTKAGEAEALKSRKVSKETIGAWVVQCSEVAGTKKSCNLAQQLIQAKTRRSVAYWIISKSSDGKIMAAITIPAGISVPAGLTVTIGKLKSQKLEYKTCLQSSCVAQFELTSASLAEMGTGEKVVFTASNLSNRQINIEFSLKGFGAAYKVYEGEVG